MAEDTSAIRTVNSKNQTQSESPDLTLHKKVYSLAESFNQMALAQESIFRTPNPCHTQPNCNTHYSTRTLFSSTPRLPPANRSLGPNSYHQPRNPSTSCFTPRSTTREPGYCYYHAKFGPSVRNCQTFCSWNQTTSCSREFRLRQSRNTVDPLSDDDGPFPPDLLFIRDPLNDLNFMIDTGNSRSLLPCNVPPDQTKAKGKMFAANESEVTLFETVRLIISLGVGRHLPWQFTRANIQFPVIGMDFLRHHGLIVDTVKQCLRNAITTGGEGKKKNPEPGRGGSAEQELNSDVTPVPSKETLKTLPITSSVEKVLHSYPCLFDFSNYSRPHRHKTQHYIETTGPSVSSRVRRLSPEKMAILKRELNKLLELVVLVPSDNEYSSPVHLVPKKDVSTESPDISVFLTSRLKLTDT